MSPDTPKQPAVQPPKATPGTNVLEDICQWAKGLPYWGQAALDQIAAGATFDDGALDLLLVCLLEDAGLAKKTAMRPELAILKRAPIAAQKPDAKKLLDEIGLFEELKKRHKRLKKAVNTGGGR
jgi:hypothetical protein